MSSESQARSLYLKAQALFAQLQDLVQQATGERLSFRALLAGAGLNLDGYLTPVALADLRKLVDKAVAEALDKRELRVGEIATDAAKRTMDVAEGKLEIIANRIHDAHVGPQLRRLRDDAENATDGARKIHVELRSRIEELAAKMQARLAELDAAKKQIDLDREATSAAAFQMNELVKRANEATAAIEARALAAATPTTPKS